MSVTYINAELRRQVMERAEGLCEYCLIHEDNSPLGHQVDHIISEKHGGPTTLDNLAYVCSFCNRYKGSDVGSIVPGTVRFVRFFNPRTDIWTDHFALLNDGITIGSSTEVGEATLRILAVNSDNRLQEREAMREIGQYPVATARRRMSR